jgi:putative heme-binding domain-containing protein
VDDPSADVRREAAISLRDVPWEKSGPLIKELYEHYDSKDPWYLEALGIALNGKEEEAYARLLQDEPKNPAEWSEAFANLVWRIHPKSAVDALRERAVAESVSDSLKKKAVDALAFIHDREAVAAMLELADLNGHEFVRELASWWVGFRKTNDWFTLWDWQSETGETFTVPEEVASLQKTLLNTEASLPHRIEAGQKMGGSLIGGRLLIYLASEKRLSDAIIDGVSKSIFKNPFQEIRTLADAYFDRPPTDSFSAPKILAHKGDTAKGESLFAAQCAVCHKNDKGGNDIGPDLGSIGEKFDQAAMLEALIHPNASIVFGYEPVMVKTKSGQAFTGFLLSEGETTVLKDFLGKQVVIAPDDIESQKKLEVGIMPDAAGLELTEQDLADLSTYLLTLKNSSL